MNRVVLETTSVWECPKLTHVVPPSWVLGWLVALAQPQEPGERQVSSAGAPVGLGLVFWERIKQQHPWTWLTRELGY